MLLKFSQENDRVGGDSYQVGNGFLRLSDVEGALVAENDDVRLIIEGELYYYLKDGHAKILDRDEEKSLRQALKRNVLGLDPAEISDHLEGNYVALWINKKRREACLFGDYLNRLNVYYRQADGEMLVGTHLRSLTDSIKGLKYDQLALYSYCLLGYVPAKETFYEGVRRIGPDESLRFSKDGATITRRSKPAYIREYGREDINRYDSLISTAVDSRASKKNVVMNSGGWDSTSLVYLLKRNHDSSSIKSLVFEVALTDKQEFNCFEVDKVKRISKFFGIKTETCRIDYADKKMIDLWESNLGLLRDNHVYFWLHHLKMADQAAGMAGRSGSVFNGEASDSIHNFGFSQFVSVNYPEMYLREYADKGKSYLSGPTFLKKISEGTYTQDEVYRFFQYYYGAARFDAAHGPTKARFESYLQSFMLSYPRVPFAKWANTDLASPKVIAQYCMHLSHEYFGELAEILTPENLYYVLLQTYRMFHFQSSQIRVNQVGLSSHGLSCMMPFLDLQMVKYMYSMPEHWGRGLELKTTKYPLRYLATERWKMPLDILEEPGPHSYIAENDKRWTYAGGSWSIYCEILFRSVFTDYFKQVFRTLPVETYFSPEVFDTKMMQGIVDRFVEGEENVPQVNLLFKLALLLSIGLQGSK